ncbi:MAG: tandem-95 repeat protein, partial [Hyphomicrobium sp.]
MDFPVFDMPYLGNRLLVALIAITHVLINHPLAVGAYPLLTLLEWHGMRSGDARWDRLARKVTSICFIVTTSVGALTGVGIWLVTALVAPFAIGSLLRVFFWAWFAEWLVFITEVVLIMVYYLTWSRWTSPRMKRVHVGVGAALAMFSWLTMAIIVAILGFMMAPGAWGDDRSLLSGVVNPLYPPQLAFRTTYSMVSGGLFLLACCFAVLRRDEALRHDAVRRISFWILGWLPLCAAAATWYWRSVPDAMQAQLKEVERLVGSEYADQLSGSSADETFDGRFGNDTLAGRGGSDRYRFGYDAGADTIVEADAVGDIDRLVLDPDVDRTALSLVRSGDDLLVELEHDDGLLIDTVLVAGHFAGPASGIEQIVFGDGTVWDRADIEGILRVGRFNAVDDVIRFADEDVELIIAPDRLTRNDATEGTEALDIVAVGNAVNGTVSLRPDGSVSFLGVQDFNGDAFFDYTVRDAFGRLSTARAEVDVRAVNDAPIANNDGVLFGVEDIPLAIDIAALLGNDFDIDGDVLSLTGVFGPIIGVDGQPLFPSVEMRGTNGATQFGFLGDLFFVPVPNHYGFAGFTYEVRDPTGATAVGTVEIHFAEVNDAPESGSDEFEARVGLVQTFEERLLLLNDRDAEGDEFRLVGIHSAENGTATLRTITEERNGVLVERQVVDFVGAELGLASFKYDIEDVHGARSTVDVLVTVVPVNDPPIAVRDDGFEAIEDAPLVLDPALLLANDWDLNGDVLHIVGFDRFSLNGKVEFTADGQTIVFAPRADFNGAAGFTYIVDDGRGGTDTAFVSITIVPDNDAPILEDDVVAAVEDQPFSILAAEAFANDIEPDGDVIFFETAVFLGVLTNDFTDRTVVERSLDLASPILDAARNVASAELASGDPLPAWLTFDAAGLRFSGIAPEGATAPVEIVVNFTDTNPSTGVTTSYSDTLIVDPADPALATGIAYDPQLLAVDLAAGTFSAALWNGRPLPGWLSFDAATRTFTSIGPVPESVESVARVWVRFTPDDPADESFAIEVRIDPREPIDPAINAMLAGETYFTSQGKWVMPVADDAAVSAQRASLVDLPDWLALDASTLTLSGTPPEEYVGTVQVRLDVGASASAGTPAYAVILGLVVDPLIDLAFLGGFDIVVTDNAIGLTTPADFNGAFALEYAARDTKDGISAEPATIVINVAPRRGAPDANDDLLAMDEDGRIEIPLAALLSNDRDEDADPIRIVAVGEVSIGTLEVRTTPVSVALPAIAGLGADAIHAAVLADGSALPDWLAIDPVTGRLSGTPPLAALGPIDVVVASLDGVNTFITELTIAVDGNGGAVLVYALEPQSSGPVVFSYTLADGRDGTDTGLVRIEIAPLNDPPVAVDDGIAAFEDQVRDIAAVELLANDTDVDGDALRIVSAANAEHGTVELVDGVVRFTPDHNFDGRASFDYVVTDDAQGEATARAYVDVQSTNLAPVAVVDRFFGFEDTPYRVDPADLLGNDFDPDGDTIMFAGMDVETTNGRAFLLPDGSYALTPRGEFTGEIAFTYRITDGRLTSQQTGTIVVDFMPVNDAPVVLDEAYTTGEDVGIEIALNDLLANDSDVEGDALSIVSVLDPVNGTVTMSGGQAVFTPRADYFGNGGFSYVVEDGQGGRTTGFVGVAVQPAGDLPFAVSDLAGEIDEDTSLVIDPATLLANDFDPDGDTISFVAVSGLGASLQSDGSILFTPAADRNGRLEFGYWITDGNGPAVAGIAYVDVRPLNDAPVASDDNFAGIEDQALVVSLAQLVANDRDVDRQSITITALGDAVGGTVALDGLGNVVFTPDADRNGAVEFSYTLADTSGATATARVTIDLAPVNDAPVIAPLSALLGVEDTPLSAYLPDLAFSDIDGDTLTTSMRLAGGAPLPGWLAYDPVAMWLTGQPPADFSGALDLEVVASDGVLEVIRAVTLVIEAVNDAPVARFDVVEALEDAAVVVPLLQLLDNDTDADGDTLQVTAIGSGAGYAAAFDGLGNLVVTRDADAHGDIDISYTLSDGRLSSTGTLRLSTTPVNDAPTIDPVADVHVAEDGTVDVVLPAG